MTKPTSRPYERSVGAWLLIALAVSFLVLFLIAPLVVVLQQAFSRGLSVYLAAIQAPEARSALYLTLLIAAVVVPLNVVFGLAAAWCISRFSFRGKNLLITLIDLPFAVSPVISGLIFVLLFGARGVFGPWLSANHLKIIFALPGMMIATLFITAPFIARELIPFMQAQGKEQEEAARVLGASGWQIFWRVTLPNIKWSLMYGVILCTARAMGEFGAVSVVSGHIRGETNTVPLYVEILYNEYQFAAAFAVASLLVLLAVLTLIAKELVESKSRRSAKKSSDAQSPAPEALAIQMIR